MTELTIEDMEKPCKCGGEIEGLHHTRSMWMCWNCHTEYTYDDDRIITRDVSY